MSDKPLHLLLEGDRRKDFTFESQWRELHTVIEQMHMRASDYRKKVVAGHGKDCPELAYADGEQRALARVLDQMDWLWPDEWPKA